MSATVKELKECLEQFDDDVEVFILNEGRGFEPACLEKELKMNSKLIEKYSKRGFALNINDLRNSRVVHNAIAHVKDIKAEKERKESTEQPESQTAN